MATRALFATSLVVFWGFPAVAEEVRPLSAIDWLSNSVTEVPDTAPANDTPVATPPDAIRVVPLDAPLPDTVGQFEANAIGVPESLWGKSTAVALVRELNLLDLGPDAPPAIRTFLTSVFQTRLAAPIDAVIDDRFYLARVDWLLGAGQLQAADQLLKLAGATEPQRFRRVFDIALLTGGETDACTLIEETPELSPTYPTRIFCLARLGQFDVAALTLGNAETLGILSEREDALLRIFLDPELFEDEVAPPAPRVPSPLEYRLYEAIGERISTDQLPVAFATVDLSDTVGWKTRLRAAERLAATGALSFEDMLQVYSERLPAASGGIWERLKAVNALSDALGRGDADAVEKTLGKTWAMAREIGYGASFAAWLAPQLTDFDLDGQAKHSAFEVALFAGRPEVAAKFANSSAEDRFLLALAKGQKGPPPVGDSFARAIAQGLSAIDAGETYATLLAEGRTGEVLFRALDALTEGAGGNPMTTTQALTALRQIGLDELARQVAVELLLIEGAA